MPQQRRGRHAIRCKRGYRRPLQRSDQCAIYCKRGHTWPKTTARTVRKSPHTLLLHFDIAHGATRVHITPASTTQTNAQTVTRGRNHPANSARTLAQTAICDHLENREYRALHRRSNHPRQQYRGEHRAIHRNTASRGHSLAGAKQSQLQIRLPSASPKARPTRCLPQITANAAADGHFNAV